MLNSLPRTLLNEISGKHPKFYKQNAKLEVK